jgi:two-component system KDP operon response regulator KdpE
VTTRPARILVVDAYPGWRVSVGKALEEAGYSVWTAHTGRHGLELCASGNLCFDLLLTAVEIVDMTGRELVRHMRTICPGLRVVFTAWGDDAAGGRGVLTKPFSLARLEQTVRRALHPRGRGPVAT